MQPTSTICPESVASATISAIRNVAVSTGTNPKLASTTTNTSVNAGASSAAVAASITTDMANAAAYIGPCSSSTEAL